MLVIELRKARVLNKNSTLSALLYRCKRLWIITLLNWNGMELSRSWAKHSQRKRAVRGL